MSRLKYWDSKDNIFKKLHTLRNSSHAVIFFLMGYIPEKKFLKVFLNKRKSGRVRLKEKAKPPGVYLKRLKAKHLIQSKDKINKSIKNIVIT